MVARVPMKRLAATQEIANAVRYLAGDEASYVTGQTIIVDGGWTIQGIPHAPEWLQSPARRVTRRGGVPSNAIVIAAWPRDTQAFAALHHPDHCVIEQA